MPPEALASSQSRVLGAEVAILPGRHDQVLRSFLLVTLSSACFAAMAIMTKHLHGHVPLLELTFYRGAFGLIPLTIILWARRIPWKAQDWPILVSRGVWGLLATLCYFWAIGKIPLALAVLLNYTSPIFTTIFAVVFLRERTTRTSLGFLFLSMFGLYLVIHPSFHGAWQGHFLGLCAGILSGAAYATVKHLTRTTSPWLIVWSFNFIISLGSLPGVLRSWPNRTSAEWFWLVCISFAGTIGQLLMALGFRGTSVSRASTATLSVLIMTTLAGWLWWGEALTVGTLMGMATILAGIIGLGVHQSTEEATRTK